MTSSSAPFALNHHQQQQHQHALQQQQALQQQAQYQQAQYQQAQQQARPSEAEKLIDNLWARTMAEISTINASKYLAMFVLYACTTPHRVLYDAYYDL